MHKFILILTLALAALHVQAGEAVPAAADPQLEKRVTALSAELRCLVCQNQSLADSHAELALDLKQQVREKLAAGMSDQDVVDFMVQRYGDFVLYRPPVKSATWPLWFGPFLLLAIGIGVLVRKVRQRERAEDAPAGDELRRAAALLDDASLAKEKL